MRVAVLDADGNITNIINVDTEEVIAGFNFIGYRILEEGENAEIWEPIESIASRLSTEIQNHLDEGARAKGYDDIISACTYAGAPNVFQAESIAFLQWRAAIWAYCYSELAKVASGQRNIPTFNELLQEFPVLVLP